jgi:hypothetical protein
MSLTGKQIHNVIARRAERAARVHVEAQGGLWNESQPEGGGFPACARCRGITKAFHKPSLTGKRNSAGFVYDGHPFEPAK